MQHVMKLQDSHEQLLERILSSENMHRAWTLVKQNTALRAWTGSPVTRCLSIFANTGRRFVNH